jgi:hypothetical protein
MRNAAWQVRGRKERRDKKRPIILFCDFAGFVLDERGFCRIMAHRKGGMTRRQSLP